jgi:phosphoenolpyruvate carboxykinase (ATP)
VQETGLRNGAFGAEKFGLKNLKTVHWNLGAPQLYQFSLSAGEAVLSADGALCADTGEFTGRSPKDKFTVRDATTEKMWWAGNQSITPDQFSTLYADFLKHAEGMTLFAQDLYGGADPTFQIKTRVFTELAWHSLFIRTLLIRPEAAALRDFVPELTIIDLPSFRADPKRHGVRSENVVAIDFARKIVLIGGSYYAGEMKKSVFTTLNYYLPAKGVMPMHCSANVGPKGDSAIFFGLSGTGKTTLSADPKRTLIGDDEHGWGSDGIFNFEGGCYAKCIKLSQEAEPEIFAASKRFGAVLENVVLDENTRRRLQDRKHPLGLSARIHPERFAHRPRRPAEERRDAGGRRLRRAAADRKTFAGAGDVSLPVRLHREGRGHRARPRQRAAAGILHLFRLAVPAARPLRLRQHAA